MANVVNAKLEADNRPGKASKGTALGAITTVMFVIPAVHLYGIEGAAFVTSASQALFLAYVWNANRRAARRS
jgi:O-antigen/teichoic acid export membrane protein